MEIGWNLEFSFGKKNSLPGKEDYRLFKNFSRDIFLFLYVPPFFLFLLLSIKWSFDVKLRPFYKVNEDGCENNLVNNKCLHETLTRIVRLKVR